MDPSAEPRPPSAGRVAVDRRGFTMLEMIIVLVILAVLTAMASVTFSNRGAAALAVMKSDLHNLAIAQEAYYSDHGTYANVASDLNFDLSANVTLLIRGNAQGWSARTEHTLKANHRCAMYVGDGVAPYSPATEEGKIACQPNTGTGCFGGS